MHVSLSLARPALPCSRIASHRVLGPDHPRPRRLLPRAVSGCRETPSVAAFILARVVVGLLLVGRMASAAEPAKRTTIAANAQFWWARTAADLNGDGILDLALQDNNAHGGWLGWLEGRADDRPWALHKIASVGPEGGAFASGDLDAGDLDGDGDIDVLGFVHPGEWDEGAAPTRIFWYENPSWKAHFIGEAPAFVKDANLADFDGDDRLDLVVITYVGNRLRVLRQLAADEWVPVQDITVPNLHEGMDVGDVDGDGDPDVATNGYWVENPGGDWRGDWPIRSIAGDWHEQTGDWSKNATKVACCDIDGDGRAEVFVSHSERPDYPVAWYAASDPKSGHWVEHRLPGELPAVHTLQVADADLDGDQDVLLGVNRGRGQALGFETWPVRLLVNEGDNTSWKTAALTDRGIYNGQVADVDGDGDPDLFRLPSHDATQLEVWWNPVRHPGQRTRWNFDGPADGALPPDWRQGFTGEGRADWRLVQTPSGGVLAQVEGGNPNRHFNVAWTTAVTVRNATLSVRLKAVSGAHDQGGGLIWRAQDERNYYVVRANPLERNVVLYKMQNGVRTDLPLVDRGRTYGQKVAELGRRWHTLSVDVHDDTFTVFLDGASLYQVRDATFTEAGHVGLWTKADAVTWFDDLQIVEHAPGVGEVGS